MPEQVRRWRGSDHHAMHPTFRSAPRFGVLFVCTGNICRSPTAEGVFRRLVTDASLQDAFDIDSAGTQGYHIGDPPDPRSIDAARARGYDLTQLRARQVRQRDFERFDLIVAMDRSHLATLDRMAQPTEREKLRLMLDYAASTQPMRDVPDPYYGSAQGFEQVLDLLEGACAGLLESVRTGVLPREGKRRP